MVWQLTVYGQEGEKKKKPKNTSLCKVLYKERETRYSASL